MKSSVIKRSIVIDGHKTSVSLEDAFWRGLKEIARGQQATLSNVVAEIDKSAPTGQPIFSDPSVRTRPGTHAGDKRALNAVFT